ncbi:MAG: hypothetical protein DLM59_08415 [Pseudonocardiales bacterium]|nr:MAG: hypothetical protein DLM59_08415 [Pseudonocardiales bacterium]
MESTETHGSLVIPSALTRDEYVELSRLLQRKQLRLPMWLAVAGLIVCGGIAVAFGPRLVGACIVLFVALLVALTWRQPYRLWSAQAQRLTAPGTVTLDDAGVARDVPGVVEGRVPWSRIASAVDTGRVVGLKLSRYEWIMFALPGDPAVARRLREVLNDRGLTS